MDNFDIKKLFLFGLVTLGINGVSSITQAASISSQEILDNWQQYSDPVRGENNARWGIDPDGSLTNNRNHGTNEFGESWNSGSIVSNLSYDGDFVFNASFSPENDDDIIGLIFGYQNQENMYRLSWTGHYFMGYSADYARYESYQPYSEGLTGLSFVKEVNDEIIPLYNDESLHWLPNRGLRRREVFDYDTRYDISITRVGSEFSFLIEKLGDDPMVSEENQRHIDEFNDKFSYSFTFSDDTFSSGKIGLNAVNQGVNFTNISIHQPSTTAVPEPLTILGAGTATIFGATFKQKLKKKSNKS